MTDQPDFLAQFSNALAARAELAKNAVVAIRLSHGRHMTGTVWRSDIVVASEQSLPRKDEFEIVAPGGSVQTARIAGRDPSTNVAILRLATPIASPSIAVGEAVTGAIALAVGADGTGGASARLGLVNLAGPGWHSSRGARGWLGVALQAVAVPDALREPAGQSSGLMVMSVVEGGPAAQAGILAGDIILSVDGTSTHRFRRIARLFGSDSIGRKADLRLIRSGAVITVQATIAERQAA